MDEDESDQTKAIHCELQASEISKTHWNRVNEEHIANIATNTRDPDKSKIFHLDENSWTPRGRVNQGQNILGGATITRRSNNNSEEQPRSWKIVE
ncbi:hypothetical protein SARC_07939 [Sphaeroforma arctica JP610]|uniref:Uncharacterized protein n=1 Tax=Sphaeroforma arctica JP610 TaxID=667725 RepID=A0A0L0FSF6_9EUKA|nr:hypothetical protein SARC_07939 [Sphaeroforma arctica JP610]KNC79675.1 hypothetical protein SARC_07939 [Sphaeroforma arctica JP610]|eukprot:XP_014153577.1 hypothetical protein SARC_07939 [Sphaeroforma arctica JP610]